MGHRPFLSFVIALTLGPLALGCSDCPPGGNAGSLFCHGSGGDAGPLGMDGGGDGARDAGAVGTDGGGGCGVTMDCDGTPATPVCDATLHRCVECLADADCHDPARPVCWAHTCGCTTLSCVSLPLTPYCDPPSRTCITGCATSTDCHDPTRPVCDVSAHTCGCGVSADCMGTPATPYCDPTMDACVMGCATRADCVTTPATPLCDIATHHCTMGCDTRADCIDPARPACDTTAHMCVPCVASSDCTDLALPVCDTTAHTCVRCVATTDCPLTDVCSSTHTCVPGCTDSSHCGAATCCAMTCRDLTTDLMNCGTCGHVCTLPHATPVCTATGCAIGSCDPGFADCNGIAADGCEVDTTSDVTHCGGCGTSCTLAHATPGCVSSGCVIVACDPGFGDCDTMPGDGCETPLSTAAHCGACGVTCPMAMPTCAPSAGGGVSCQLICSAPATDCRGVCVDTRTDAMDCGMCGMVCPAPPNASAICTTPGTCGFTCNMSFANCDGLAPNGCEVNTSTDAGNCGSCRHVCSLANATAVCTAGGCAIGSCNAGFADCDGVASNGCEANLSADTTCGACSRNCGGVPGTGYCFASACAPWPSDTMIGMGGLACGDMGPDNTVGGRFLSDETITGRPGAAVTRQCHHGSCGGAPVIAPCPLPGLTTLDGTGTFHYVDHGGTNCVGADPCNSATAGEWETGVVIDGRFSGWTSGFTYYDSCCPAYGSCGTRICPTCFPATCS